MGPKASKMNDDNLVIVRNAPGLAAEYAVNILGVYGHYRWLYNAWKKASVGVPPKVKGQKSKPAPVIPSYDGNVDSDQWQLWESTGANLAQLQFLLGRSIAAQSVPSTPAARHPASAPPRPS
jgi:hypothetical protein